MSTISNPPNGVLRYIGYYASEVDFGVLEVNEGDDDYDVAKKTFEQAHRDVLEEIQFKINSLNKLLKSVRTYKPQELIRH